MRFSYRLMMRPTLPTLVVVSLVAVSSCSDPGATPPSAPVARGDGVIGPPTITRAAAGQDQRATVGTRVPIAPRILVTDADGDPVPGVAVTFFPREGNGVVEGSEAVTGSDGTAGVGAWTLGPVRGGNVLVGEVPGLAPVEFRAEGLPGANGSMVIAEGDVQYAGVGQPVATAPAVLVRDKDDKPVVGRQVTFRVVAGGGQAGNMTAVTDDSGVARSAWTLGPSPGENTLVAETADLPNISFRAIAVSSEDPVLQREVVVSNLSVPWDIAFAPDGAMLFSLRAGSIRVLRPGSTTPVQLLAAPTDLDAQSQSGLLGIALDPRFAQNRYLYVYMSSRRSGSVDNRVRRFIVAPDWSSATEDRDILTGISWGSAGGHSGGRIRFGPDGNLWITTGDTRSATVPQDMNALGGKVLRVNTDGNAAPGNPGLGPRGVVYAFGLRNPQGIAFRPTDGAPFICEHGPNQDDEVTRLLPGGNGGWNPNDGNGNYNGYAGARMTDTTAFPNALRPGLVVSDSEGMSGCDFAQGPTWKSWDGRIVVGMLAGRRVVSARFDTPGIRTVTGPTNAFVGVSQIRAVTRGPDGFLYVATNGSAPNDQIWRVRVQ
jgi:glucose/arabinose dehydrogenase